MRPLIRLLLSNRQRGPSAATDFDKGAVPVESSEHAEIVRETTEHTEAGRFSQALALVDHAIEKDSASAELILARGSILFTWRRYHEAHAALVTALQSASTNAQALVKLGWTCIWIGRLDDAADAMRRAVELDPNDWAAHFGLGSVLRAQEHVPESKRSFERAAELEPHSPHCLSSLIACEIRLANYEAAERLARRLVASCPDKPAAYADLGMALCSQGRHEEAIAAFQRAEGLEAAGGDMGDDAVNFAICLLDAGRTEQALTWMERRMRHDANQGLHSQYGLALLIAGRFEEGWRQYEFRWLDEPLLAAPRNFVKPPWVGQDLRDKTILLWSEQGFGDFIQFIRYAPLLKARGAKVVVFLRDELRQLARSMPALDVILGSAEPYPPFDYYVNLLSLPRIFNTDLSSIPAEVPYLFAEPERRAQWSRRITDAPGLKVGIVWAGSATHTRDRFRSLTLERLAPLFDVAGVRFFSLQKGRAASELTETPCACNVEDLAAGFDDFADTAAAIDNLDLIIAVDTSVAHLAGALGKPVWMLSATPADWRWMEHRDDSPWYPTMRVFRQSSPGRWDDVILEVKQALGQAAGNRGYTFGKVAEGLPVSTPRDAAIVSRSGTRAGGLAETRYGIMQYFPDEEIAADIDYYGEHRQCELDLLAQFVGPSAAVLETDAGIGAHALWLSRHVGPEGHVFLYEDDRMRRQALGQNLFANRVANVTLMRRRLRSAGSGHELPYRSSHDRFASAESMQDADESVDELRLARLDLLKLNDGARAPDLMGGASDTLWRLRPRLHVRMRSDEELNRVADRASEFGYACWRCETPLFNPHNFYERSDDRHAGRTALALLAFPEEHDISIPFSGCRRIA